MTAENTIQWMLDFYDNIFPTRKHCLNHLFCVIGNGYEWIDGELVSKHNQFAQRYKMIQDIEHAKGRFEDDWYSMDQILRTSEKDANKPVQRSLYYTFQWYPPCPQYSYLYNYPDNITESWKAVLNECKQLLIEDGFLEAK